MKRKIKILCLLTVLMLGIINADNEKSEIKYPNVSIHAQDTHLPSILAILLYVGTLPNSFDCRFTFSVGF